MARNVLKTIVHIGGVAICLVCVSGCGTIMRNRIYDQDPRFASVRTDVDIIGHIFGPPRGKFDFTSGAYPFVVLPVVDLPFAGVRDVIQFPYDAQQAAKHKKDKAFWDNVLATGEGTPEEGAKRMSRFTDDRLYWFMDMHHWKVREPPPQPQTIDTIVKASVMSNRERVLWSASAYPKLTEEQCELLFDWQEKHPKSYSASTVRANLVGVPATPFPLLLKLVEMNEDASQINAIKSNRLPLPMVTNLIERLASSTNRTTQSFVAAHPLTSPEQLDALAYAGLTQDYAFNTSYVVDVVARNPNTALSTLQMLGGQDDISRMYKGLGSNPRTPVDVLLKIIDCPYGATRYDPIKAVIKNPNLPQEKIIEYASTMPSSMLEDLCKNPSLPVTLIQSFATNKDERIRAAIASNPSTPVEVLKGFTKDKYWVRKNLLTNPSATDAILQELLTTDLRGDAAQELKRRENKNL